MIAEAAHLPGLPEQTVAYSFLSLTPPQLQDLRLDVDMDLGGSVLRHYRTAGYAPLDLYARGAAVSPIDGGLFSIDALLRIE